MIPSALSFISFYENFFKINSSTLKSPQKINILILAPHPDDECLMASAPLRLQLENQAQVTAVAITLGSNKARQEERKKEFKEACALLGFKSEVLSDDWEKKLDELSKIIKAENINLLVCPHLKDHHPAHIKTAELTLKLIERTKFNGTLLMSEFWGELEEPNLLVEVTREVFTLQFNALEKHIGEVERNPYHLRLASHQVNSVRRGAEKVAVLGSAAPDFAFGNLYEGYQVVDGEMKKLAPQILDYTSDLSSIS
ncbi:MAG: PIG-L family deacetylase [Bacteriovoracaceae bacterium]